MRIILDVGRIRLYWLWRLRDIGAWSDKQQLTVECVVGELRDGTFVGHAADMASWLGDVSASSVQQAIREHGNDKAGMNAIRRGGLVIAILAVTRQLNRQPKNYAELQGCAYVIYTALRTPYPVAVRVIQLGEQAFVEECAARVLRFPGKKHLK